MKFDRQTDRSPNRHPQTLKRQYFDFHSGLNVYGRRSLGHPIVNKATSAKINRDDRARISLTAAFCGHQISMAKVLVTVADVP